MKTILVPSDFSKNAETALRYAIRLGKMTKASLVVFHCAHLSPFALASTAASYEKLQVLEKEDEAFKLEKLTREVSKAYKYFGIKKIPSTTKIVVESKPLLVENILELAAQYNADLIVAGTHGATGLNRFFFGSNTANLISKSSIPVLAIPEKYKFQKIRKIAFSTDLENTGEELGRLLPLAQALKAGIDMVYLDYGIDINNDKMLVAEKIIGQSGYSKIKLVKQKATIEYSLIRQLKKYLDRHPHQLLVMFTRERRFWEKVFLGGKTELMSYTLPVPLLSFKKR